MPNSPKVIMVNCLYCGKEFQGRPYWLKQGKGKYCTRQCANIHMHEVDPEARFWSQVDIKNNDEECWNFLGCKKMGGYGRLTMNRKDYGAHRFAYESMVGKIPEGILIQHKCDNPACCNPKHLSLGTDKTNSDDKIRKGRANLPVGENVHTSKLSPEIVLEIRAVYNKQKSFRVWGLEYGVSASAIEDIVKRITWIHI